MNVLKNLRVRWSQKTKKSTLKSWRKIVEMMQKIVNFVWRKPFLRYANRHRPKNSEHIWWILCLKLFIFCAEPHYLTDNLMFWSRRQQIQYICCSLILEFRNFLWDPSNSNFHCAIEFEGVIRDHPRTNSFKLLMLGVGRVWQPVSDVLATWLNTLLSGPLSLSVSGTSASPEVSNPLYGKGS